MLDAFSGLSSTAFRDSSGPGFMQTVATEEALARLQYLVDQQFRLGIVLGESGVGKSVLLSHFDSGCRAAGNDTGRINLIGVGLEEFLFQLARQLQVYYTRTVSEAWQKIFDQIQLNGYQQRNTILMFDDVDEAEPEVLKAIRRLTLGATHHPLRLTAILSIDSARAHYVDSALFETASLRVELWPWFREEVDAYVRQELNRVKRHDQPFSPGAIDRLFEVSEGLPRQVSRLSRISADRRYRGGERDDHRRNHRRRRGRTAILADQVGAFCQARSAATVPGEGDERQFLQECLDSDNQLFLAGWVDGAVVSTLSFHGGQRPRLRHAGEFGMSVDRKFWGLGIGSVLVDVMIDWARYHQVITKINLRVRTDNDRAIEIYQRKGFSIEGTFQKDMLINGEYFDHHWMGLDLT